MGRPSTSGTWTPTKRRGPIAAEFQGPGPAAVVLPSIFGNANVKESHVNRAPAYSFGSRPERKVNADSPAPNTYNTRGLSERGKDETKAPSLHTRFADPKAFVTPAPGAYNPEHADKDIRSSAPKYSFGLKGRSDRPADNPAPNAYTLPDGRDAPSYSLAGRPKEPKGFATPAPGTYEAADPNRYKNRSPVYSLSNRFDLPADHTNKPGPGTYAPEKVKLDHSPGYAFGIKHSPYVGTLKGDNWGNNATTYDGIANVRANRNKPNDYSKPNSDSYKPSNDFNKGFDPKALVQVPVKYDANNNADNNKNDFGTNNKNDYGNNNNNLGNNSNLDKYNYGNLANNTSNSSVAIRRDTETEAQMRESYMSRGSETQTSAKFGSNNALMSSNNAVVSNSSLMSSQQMEKSAREEQSKYAMSNGVQQSRSGLSRETTITSHEKFETSGSETTVKANMNTHRARSNTFTKTDAPLAVK